MNAGVLAGMAEKRPDPAAQARGCPGARAPDRAQRPRARSGDQVRRPGHAVGALRPGAVRAGDDPLGLLRAGHGLVRPPPDRGPRDFDGPQAAGDLRGQPLAATWTRRRSCGRCRASGASARRSPRRPTTSTASAGSRRRVAALQHGADLARRRRHGQGLGGPPAPPHRQALEPPAVPRGHALADGSRSASCTPAPPSSPPRTTSPILPIFVAGTRDAMPPGRSWPRRLRAGRIGRQPICVRFGPPIRALPGEHRNETMARVQALVRRPGRPRLLGRAAAALAAPPRRPPRNGR